MSSSSSFHIAFAPLAILLLALALVAVLAGCVFLGTALARGRVRGPITLLAVVAILLMVFSLASPTVSDSVQVSAQALPPAPAQAGEAVKAAAPKAAPRGTSKFPVWTLDESNPDWKETWKATPQQSLDEAVALITVELNDYLRNQQPPLDWTPPPGFVENLVKRTVSLKEKKLADAPSAKKYRYDGTIEMTPALRAEILRHDREFRSQHRMFWLGLVVAGLVALLSVVAVYVHMDELTRGYYTGWLRVAAVGFLGGIAVVLLLIA